jgi:2-oxoglutarate ferredoxin oxidoreductase subunit gamma
MEKVMRAEVVIAGSGSGALLAVRLLACAGMAEGLRVATPTPPSEVRREEAVCLLTDGKESAAPDLGGRLTAAVTLDATSMQLYEPLVEPAGWLLIDSSLDRLRTPRHDIHEVALPAREIAASLGVPHAANIVMLGALAAATGIVSIESLERALKEQLERTHPGAYEANKRALRCGVVSVRQAVPV